MELTNKFITHKTIENYGDYVNTSNNTSFDNKLKEHFENHNILSKVLTSKQLKDCLKK